MTKKAILLINVGTPDSPQIADVRKYLKQFLNDKRVITLPKLLRKILVNGIIIPFRTKKSSELYSKLWTDKGSPLLFYLKELAEKIDKITSENTKLVYGMRYGNPSVQNAINDIKDFNPDKIIVLPLYPQYASSTTESAFDAVKKALKLWENAPQLKFIKQFYDHPGFINAFVHRIKQYNPLDYDHIVFSYHGLPLSHLQDIHPKVDAINCNCSENVPDYGKYCYKASCYHTSRLLVDELELEKNTYSIGFQSRLSKNWTSPFTDEIIKNLAKEGKKNILVIAPSFVTDCLETIIEIEDEYQELFIQNGGSNLTLVKSLNSSSVWAEALLKICSEESA